MWDDFQKQRLALEARELVDSHPHCEFFIEDSTALVRVWHQVAGVWYRLRIDIPSMYPDEKPQVFVEIPMPLLSYWPGKKIADFAPNHNYHVLSTNSSGEVQICHFGPDRWDATKSLHLVLMKAKLWLQAFGEHHLRTGQPICDFFGDCIK